MQIIRESDSMLLTRITGKASDDIWVSFGYFDGDGEFGKSYFERNNLNALCFISKRNNWFQHKDIWEFIDAACEITAQSKGRVILYGSSMGGFGALAFSRKLNATHVIAAAPQISVDPRLVGTFDRRWPDIGSALDFEIADCREGMSSTAHIVILYDNLSVVDAQHVERLKVIPNVTAYAFPLSGHGCLYTLNNAHILQPMLPFLTQTKGVSDCYVASIRRAYKTAVRTTPDYYFAAGERYFNANRYEKASKWLWQALEINPKFGPAAERLADTISQFWMQGTDTVPEFIKLIVFLIQKEALALAEHVAEKALTVHPQSPHILQIAGAIAASQERYDQALSYLEAAIEGVPDIFPWYLGAAHAAVLGGNHYKSTAIMQKAKDRFGDMPEIFEFEHAFLNPDAVPNFVSRITKSLESKDFEEARTLVRDALSIHSQDPHLFYMAAVVDAEQEYYESALDYFEQAINLLPDLLPWYLGAAHMAFLISDHHKSIDLIQRARDRFGEVPEIIDFEKTYYHSFTLNGLSNAENDEFIIPFVSIGSNCEVGHALDVILRDNQLAPQNGSVTQARIVSETQLLRYCRIDLSAIIKILKSDICTIADGRKWNFLYRFIDDHGAGDHHESIDLDPVSIKRFDALLQKYPSGTIHLDLSYGSDFWLHGIVGDGRVIHEDFAESRMKAMVKTLYLASKLIHALSALRPVVFLLKILKHEGSIDQVNRLIELLHRYRGDRFVLGIICETGALGVLPYNHHMPAIFQNSANVLVLETPVLCPHARALEIDEFTTFPVWEGFIAACRDHFLHLFGVNAKEDRVNQSS